MSLIYLQSPTKHYWAMVSAGCFFLKKNSWVCSRFAILVRKLLSKPWNNHGMFWFSRGSPDFHKTQRGVRPSATEEPTTAMHQPRGCPSAAAVWLRSRISGPSCGTLDWFCDWKIYRKHQKKLCFFEANLGYSILSYEVFCRCSKPTVLEREGVWLDASKATIVDGEPGG